MIGDMSRRISALLLLTAATVLCAFGGAALAAGNSISINVPTNAKVNKNYSFTVSGFAPTTERLYYFNDVKKCGANPHVEHAVHNANGYAPTVHGNFKYVSGGWRSPQAKTYYVCAYLVKSSEPKNGPNGVLLRASKGFTVGT